MKKWWIRLAVGMMACLCLSGCGGSETTLEKQNRQLDLAQLEQLSVRMRDGMIRFHRTQGAARAVLSGSREGVFLGGAPELQITALDGRTEVEVRGGGIGFGSRDYTLDLYLPDDQTVKQLECNLVATELICEKFRFDKVIVQTTKGEWTMRDVTANTLDFTIQGGQIDLEDCMVGYADIDLRNGTFTSNFTNGRSDLRLSMRLGTFSAEGSFEEIRTDCLDGEVTVVSDFPPRFLASRMGKGTGVFVVPEEETGFFLQTEFGSGSVASEFSGELDQEAGTLLVGDGRAEYHLAVTTGRIDLNKY